MNCPNCLRDVSTLIEVECAIGNALLCAPCLADIDRTPARESRPDFFEADTLVDNEPIPVRERRSLPELDFDWSDMT